MVLGERHPWGLCFLSQPFSVPAWPRVLGMVFESCCVFKRVAAACESALPAADVRNGEDSG